MRQKKNGISVQELIGIKGFTDYGLETKDGELVFFSIAPTNLAVLSKSSIDGKIVRWMTALSACPDLEAVCIDAAESFDGNREYLTRQKNSEDNPRIRDILQKDLIFLDQMQAEIASARQFVLIVRLRSDKPDQIFQTVNRVGKLLDGEDFEAIRLKKGDIKRLLALYFDASGNGDGLPDTDGGQYLTFSQEIRPNGQKEETPEPQPQSEGTGIELGGGFGGFQRGKEDNGSS